MFARLIDLLYEFLFWSIGMLMIMLYGFRVEGSRRVPRKGPVLFIANHQSYLDIVTAGLASPRRMFFLAKKPLFGSRILAWIMRQFETISIDSAGMSRAGLEGVLAHIKTGKAVLVFPEGERCFDGKLNELRPGVSLLVRKAKVPVVPIGIAGAFHAWPRQRALPVFAPPFLAFGRQRIAVSVGKPLDGEKLAALTREDMMATLHAELQRVVDRAERLHGVR